ncbi:hypothetical protein B0H13DRAFT_2353907 [Mycena leptocephala]|nr:hypothetical protein B0H13DRAFT_2353907 [Mycena leptocephala]
MSASRSATPERTHGHGHTYSSLSTPALHVLHVLQRQRRFDPCEEFECGCGGVPADSDFGYGCSDPWRAVRTLEPVPRTAPPATAPLYFYLSFVGTCLATRVELSKFKFEFTIFKFNFQRAAHGIPHLASSPVSFNTNPTPHPDIHLHIRCSPPPTQRSRRSAVRAPTYPASMNLRVSAFSTSAFSTSLDKPPVLPHRRTCKFGLRRRFRHEFGLELEWREGAGEVGLCICCVFRFHVFLGVFLTPSSASFASSLAAFPSHTKTTNVNTSAPPFGPLTLPVALRHALAGAGWVGAEREGPGLVRGSRDVRAALGRAGACVMEGGTSRAWNEGVSLTLPLHLPANPRSTHRHHSWERTLGVP